MPFPRMTTRWWMIAGPLSKHDLAKDERIQEHAMARWRIRISTLILSIAIVASLIIGVVGTIIPLRIGIKAFQPMEF